MARSPQREPTETEPAAQVQRYRMPAELESQDAVWLQWPDRSMPENHQMKLEGTWLAIVAAIAGSVGVHVIVPSADSADRLDHELAWFDLSHGVELHVIATDDVWARDSGPTFVIDGVPASASSATRFN